MKNKREGDMERGKRRCRKVKAKVESEAQTRQDKDIRGFQINESKLKRE